MRIQIPSSVDRAADEQFFVEQFFVELTSNNVNFITANNNNQHHWRI